MIKFVHCADLHLDSPFITEDAQKGAIRRKELRATFSRMIERSKSFGADIVFIAGDLFDRGVVTGDTLDLVFSDMASFSECKFIITPGNHDFYTPDSVWERVALPENVFVFKSEELESITLEAVGKDKERVNIYGYAFTSQNMEKSPIDGFKISEGDKNDINILCAHADIFSRTTNYCPMTADQIIGAGFDYAALGHVHGGGELFSRDNTTYGYSGSLEGQSFHDCGERGAFFLTLEKSGGKAEVKYEFVPLANRVYICGEIDLSGSVNAEEILEKIRVFVEKQSCDERIMLRLILTGDISPSADIPTERIKALFANVSALEIKDETLPLFDCDALMNDLTVKGAFFRELLPKLSSEDERERAVAIKALKYGLAALSGGEVIDFV
ncbi:MAG: metallophosphoesterase [Clostridia bacterium]|nr:metallophosphoesterase [Clostridia bacterium]